jgi:hypothetical protein
VPIGWEFDLHVGACTAPCLITISPIAQWAYVTELEKRAQRGHRLAYLHVVEPRMDGTEKYNRAIVGSNDFFRQIWQASLSKQVA